MPHLFQQAPISWFVRSKFLYFIFVMVISSKFLFKFISFCIMCFLNKLLILGILFSIAVSAVFVAKPLILCILVSNSPILAPEWSFFPFPNSTFPVWYLVFKTNALVQSYLLLQLIYHAQVFWQHHFLQHHLVYWNQQELALIFQCLIYQLQFLTELYFFSAKLEVSICVTFLRSAFVA